MLFIARFQDSPNSRHLRRAQNAAQQTYLSKNKSKIPVAGPAARDDLGNEMGGLWYIEAKSRRDAQDICHAAPFWQAGVWSNVTVMSQQASSNPYANVRVTCL